MDNAAQERIAPTRLLRLPEVMQRVGLRRSALYALIAAGKFPRQVRLTSTSVAWRESEINHFIQSRPAATR
jgi:prophage regulatory protein